MMPTSSRGSLRPTRTRALFAAMLASGIAHAEVDLTRLPLERLLEMRVIAASSYEQSGADAPSAVSVITAEDIRNRGYRTLAAALHSLPGLYVTDDLNYTYLGSRGFNRVGDYNSRFQLSVNGRRTNDALFDMAYLGTEFPIDMALIERIEFAPGPGSSIYGSNAVLGVINVVTRTAAGLDGWHVAAAAGSDKLRELGVSFGHRHSSGLELVASLSGLRTNGQDFYYPAFDTPPNRGGMSSGQNGEHYRRGYLRATYGGFDFEAFGSRRDKDAPSAYSDSDFLKPNRLVDTLGFAVLRYRRELSDRTQLEATLSSGGYDYIGIYPTDLGVSNRDDATARMRAGELRLVTSRWNGHKVVAGVELQRDVRLDQTNADPDVIYLDRHDHGKRAAVYVQDEWRFHQRWLLNAGVRYDRYYSFGSSTNPRIALIGQLTPATTFKLLYGSAFRAPNAFELYYQIGDGAPGPKLEPEATRSAEVVLEQAGERWRWRVSAFHYRFDDLIDQVEQLDGYFAFRNQGKVTGRGAELFATALLPFGARGSLSASLHDIVQGDGQRITNSPRYTAKAALEAPLGSSGIRGAIESVVLGPRLDRDRGTVPVSIGTNLVLTSERPWHGLAFSLGVYNLFDRRNMEPVSEYFAQAQVAGRARHFRLGAEWRF